MASPSLAQPTGSFNYEFLVNDDGFTTVKATYRSKNDRGSSWIFVPKFSGWANQTIKGVITEWSLRDTETLTGTDYIFYEALRFSFTSDGSEFEMNVWFNASTGALMIEPDGIFYSPQIGFEKGNRLKATIDLPSGFSVNQGEAFTFGSSTYRPSSTGSNSNYVVFDNIPETENLMRIEIGFKTPKKTPELVQFHDGIFTFETVPRYAEYAQEVLDLYNRTYADFVSLFNVTLQQAEIRFFLPDFNSLLAVGGYVPFSGGRVGDIHINIVYTRSVEGYVETIALHELVHHFLWKTGISPQNLLWFHEGMAQYVSLEVASKLGYEGAQMMREELENGTIELKRSIGENFGFLKTWSPQRTPQNMGTYYVAAHYVVSKLAENRAGLRYYANLFKLMHGEKVDSNTELARYMSLAANESVVRTLNNWGFGIPDLYVFSPLLGGAEEILASVNPIYQPYKFLAELLYQQALLNASDDNTVTMHLYLAAAIFIARLAPLLTLITVAGILFGAAIWVLSKEGVFLKD